MEKLSGTDCVLAEATSRVDHRASVTTALNLLVERTSCKYIIIAHVPSRNFVSFQPDVISSKRHFVSRCASDTGKCQYKLFLDRGRDIVIWLKDDFLCNDVKRDIIITKV